MKSMCEQHGRGVVVIWEQLLPGVVCPRVLDCPVCAQLAVLVARAEKWRKAIEGRAVLNEMRKDDAIVPRTSNAHDDLLAACKQTIEACGECNGSGHNMLGGETYPCHTCSDARAAVAKVEGGEA